MENTINIKSVKMTAEMKEEIAERTAKAFVENKIFYLSLKGRVIDGVNGTSVVRRAHLAKISFADVFYHEDNFAMWCAKDFVKMYGNNFTRDVLCTSDWGDEIGDVDRTFITLTWRDENNEVIAQVQVMASHMRECDCKIMPNYIVH